MNNTIFIFFLTVFFGFVGSVQLGTVNSLVIQTTLQYRFKAGLWVALGGIIPELIYAFLAIQCASYISKEWLQFLEILLIPYLLILGLWNIFMLKSSKIKEKQIEKFSFRLGLIAGLLNPQLFPFWLTIVVWMQLTGWVIIKTWIDVLGFVIGSAVGTYGILWVFAWIADKSRNKLIQLRGLHINQVVGSILCLMALLQFFHIYSVF